MQIADSVAVITGAASGLGEGAARLLAERGAKVAILDLADSRGQTVADELGPTAVFRPVDVTDPDSVRESIDTVVEAFGRIDVALNAAGVSPAHRVLTRDGDMFPLELFKNTLEVNLVGTFDVVRNAARVMAGNHPSAEGERGLIVNVASAAAFEGQVGQAAYTASKGAIQALTLQLARDLSNIGVRVMTACRGVMDTAMLADVDENRRASIAELHLFPKRLGTPNDFAMLVTGFMENTLLNGETVRLDAATRLGAK